MSIHKEGYKILLFTFLICLIVNVSAFVMIKNVPVNISILSITLIVFLLFLQFFRNPDRTLNDKDNNSIICPADGKVVAIEEVMESECYNEKRLQISIFMSPLNVHVNRYPISGVIRYFKYHPGKYLVAWHPKSSTENERTTIVIDGGINKNILVRQIAGALARRIVCYSKEGDSVVKGTDLGFIKFGSRVDLFLPLSTKISVKIGDVVKGNVSVIGYF
jgi:phosphatidylserine decarboxylase